MYVCTYVNLCKQELYVSRAFICKILFEMREYALAVWDGVNRTFGCMSSRNLDRIIGAKLKW